MKNVILRSSVVLIVIVVCVILGVFTGNAIQSLKQTQNVWDARLQGYNQAESLVWQLPDLMYQEDEESFNNFSQLFKDKLTPSLHGVLFSSFVEKNLRYSVISVKGRLVGQEDYDFLVYVKTFDGIKEGDAVLRVGFKEGKMNSISRYF